MLYFKHKLRKREKIVWKKVKDIIKTTTKSLWNFVWRKINLCDFFFLSFWGVRINYTENSVVGMYHSIWWRKISIAPMDTSQKGSNPATAWCLKSHWPDQDPFWTTELLTWFLNPIHWAQKSSSERIKLKKKWAIFIYWWNRWTAAFMVIVN